MNPQQANLEAVPADQLSVVSVPMEAPPRRAPRPTPDSLRERLDPLAIQRLDLLRRSRENLRRHMRRAAVRVVVLALFDLATFWILRAAIRAVRDYALTGAVIAQFFQTYLPRGYLSGWQFGGALMVSLAVTGNYGQGDRRRDTGRLFAGCALAVALPLWMPLWTGSAELVVVQYLFTVALVWGALYANRLTVDRIVGFLRDPRQDAARTVFVGTREACAAAAASPAFHGAVDTRVVGWVEVGHGASEGSLGGVTELARIVEEQRIETVVIAGAMRDRTFDHAVEVALTAGCHLLALPNEVEFPGVSPSVVWRSGQAVLEMHPVALRGRQLLLKRTMDLILGSVALLVLSPLLVGAAIAVRLSSPGPVLFRQRRLGRNGTAFGCLKFRSMYPDAEQRLRSDPALYAEYLANNYKFPEDRDPRITPVGRLLRKTSLDELPQLLNVLKGDMSLVGPRPIVPEEIDQYGRNEMPVFLSLKPGMTGAWQVQGRSRVGYPDRAAMELDYAREWSLGLDLLILLRTVPAVLKRSGAH